MPYPNTLPGKTSRAFPLNLGTETIAQTTRTITIQNK
jgi:hypothetical protein